MELKTIEELYGDVFICPCGADAVVYGLCSTCWHQRARERASEAIAEQLTVKQIREDIMGYGIRGDDTQDHRYDPACLINRLPRWLRWLLLGILAALFVDGLWRTL